MINNDAKESCWQYLANFITAFEVTDFTVGHPAGEVVTNLYT
jgi:hypothetical protein